MERIAICGAGGFARETLVLIEQLGLASRVDALFESDAVWHDRQVAGISVLPLSRFEPGKNVMVIAIGNPGVRRAIWETLPTGTRFPTLIHPSVNLSRSVDIGIGSIVCAGVVLTCDTHIGIQVQLDRCVTVGHDSTIDDFSTLAPGAVVSGNCRIGRGAYVGAAACIREKLAVGDESLVGMGAIVVKSVPAGETQVGNPARRLIRMRTDVP